GRAGRMQSARGGRLHALRRGDVAAPRRARGSPAANGLAPGTAPLPCGVDERRRIAAELHDRLVQTLASIDLRMLACYDMWRERQIEPLGKELLFLKRLM